MKISFATNDHIVDINVDENAIRWSQTTGANVAWAANVVQSISRAFPKYHLESFSFVENDDNNIHYDVHVVWVKK